MKQDHVVTLAAIAGVIWLLWLKYYNTNVSISGGTPVPVALNNSTYSGVPWYLNYNTQPAFDGYSMPALPSQSTGIQNAGMGAPCSTCAQVGASYGSQY